MSKSKLEESFLAMGIDPTIASLAARGRDGLREDSHLASGQDDPLSDPAASVDPAAAVARTMASVKVPGKFSVLHADVINQTFSFEQALSQCYLKLEDVIGILAALVQNTTRDQAKNTLATWLKAAGFVPESANRAADALVGPDEFPNATARAAAGKQTVGKGKESRRFLASDLEGKAIAILEAADETDAELFAWRNLDGFLGNIRDLGAGEQLVSDMVQSFKEFGLNENQTLAWMHDRGHLEEDHRQSNLPVIQVPYQAPDPRFLKTGLRENQSGKRTSGEINLREKGKR
jgi:hypothetical protein